MGKGTSWLLLGSELGEKNNAIDEIRRKSGGAEETVYYAGETPLAEIISTLRTGSLFADARIFFIKRCEEIKKKDELSLLCSYLASQADDTSLILISDETSVAKALEQAISPAQKKVFWELLDNRKREWVETFFRKEGFKISSDGVEAVLEMVENNTAALQQECSRLILFLDKDREVSPEDAERWLSHTREESVFTLFSRVAAGDLSRSLECARVLLAARETPQAIFAGLASCFRKLASYLALKDSGVTDEWEFKKIGVSAPGAKRDYSSAARRYTSPDAETCLALTAEYDFMLRSSSSFPQQILMDKYLHTIHALALKDSFKAPVKALP